MKRNLFADVIHNADQRSGASVDYAKGAIVGVVSGMMAFGWSFEAALEKVASHWRYTYRIECIPEPWLNDFKKYLSKPRY